MSLSNQEVRLAVYQTYARTVEAGGNTFDTGYGDKVANWVINGTAHAERVKPVIPQPGSKPEVEYDPSRYTYIKEGLSAEVFALNHPRLGAQPVITSTVLKYDEATGTFETENTRYVPAGQRA